MEFASLTVSKIHILRVDPGEDVLGTVREFIRKAGVRQAVVLGGYGTLAAYHLHWVTHNRIPTDNAFERGEGGIEILSMNGLVVEGEPHIHVVVHDVTKDELHVGHLEEGSRCCFRLELGLIVLEGVKTKRVTDPATNLVDIYAVEE